MKEQINCLNCEEKLMPKEGFCHHCGQRTDLGRLTIKEILSEFLSSVFNIDAPFPKTLRKMFFQPHLIIKEFIHGKRKSYYAPVKYMVLCLFLNILIGELVGFDPIDNQRAIDQGPMDSDSQLGYRAGNFLSKYLNYFLFLLPFSIAIFSKMFFWRSAYNFAERTAMGFYLSGQFILISLIPIFLSFIHPLLFLLMHPLSILYFTYSFYRFFEMPSVLSRFFLAFFTAFFSFFGYIAFSFVMALVIVKYFFTS